MQKLIKTTRNKRSGGSSYLKNFYKMYIPSKLEIQYERSMYFSFDFGWYFKHDESYLSA